MNIPPLWLAILVACLFAVPLLLRLAGVRRKGVTPRKRLVFDDRSETVEPLQEAQLFRLGRLSLAEPDAERVRR